jgi:hypothetical protein
MPRTIAKLRVANLRQPKASPLALGRQARLAFAAKLKGQGNLLPFGVPEDVRAELAGITIVDAKDLFPAGNGLPEQVVNLTWHGLSRRFGDTEIDS